MLKLADNMLSMVLHEGTDSQRIDVVFDVYRDSSIKNAEREKRGSESGHEYGNTGFVRVLKTLEF